MDNARALDGSELPVGARSIAGARLADGRLVFVGDAPPGIGAGATIRCLIEGTVVPAVIAIPPSLIVYCEPSVQLAPLLEVDELSVRHEAASDVSPEFVLLAEDERPDPDTLRRMLALAYAESGRLDDEGDYPEHPRTDQRPSRRR